MTWEIHCINFYLGLWTLWRTFNSMEDLELYGGSCTNVTLVIKIWEIVYWFQCKTFTSGGGRWALEDLELCRKPWTLEDLELYVGPWTLEDLDLYGWPWTLRTLNSMKDIELYGGHWTLKDLELWRTLNSMEDLELWMTEL